LNYVLKYQNPRRIRKALEEAMPTELFDLYETIMSRIIQSEDDSKNLALQTLSWVLYAKRPLRMDELREAAAIEEGDRRLDKEDLPPSKTLVELCGSFIIHDKLGGVVELSHETVKEFLLLRHSCQLVSKVGIAQMCLTYLSFDVFDDPCLDIQAFLTRFRNLSFAQYAIQFWGFHTREAESRLRIQQAVLSLLASENKKNCLHQMVEYARWRNVFTFTSRESLLQILATNGLVETCRLVLDQTLNQSSRYTLLIPSTLI
jgi:hypothetical protein